MPVACCRLDFACRTVPTVWRTLPVSVLLVAFYTPHLVPAHTMRPGAARTVPCDMVSHKEVVAVACSAPHGRVLGRCVRVPGRMSAESWGNGGESWSDVATQVRPGPADRLVELLLLRLHVVLRERLRRRRLLRKHTGVRRLPCNTLHHDHATRDTSRASEAS